MRSDVRIAMIREVADRWLVANARSEFRFAIIPHSGKSEVDVRMLVGSLRSWRDGRIKLGRMDPIPDLGVREVVGTNTIEVWSSDCDRLRKLSSWLQERGFDTDFIW